MFGFGKKADPAPMMTGMYVMEEDEEDEEEEEEVHTAENPYCSELDCWCHTDVDYHAQVQHPEVTEEEVEVSYSFFGISLKRR